ncbi:tail fiber protein [Halomonas coralii]|uniref:phage tail protein n=1 Tax=Modicisalibacter sp. R2A 31.J TaxID=2831898 RepID=UPI001CCE9980|nr:tail fiber protein [Modicisalibacter sp. R2A 31.J]MBZ9557598.1 tail fiber protein [Modicisalibacter sp. R2A 31.J]
MKTTLQRLTIGLGLVTLAGASTTTLACSLDDGYIGSVCWTAASYCPRGFVDASGRQGQGDILLPIAQNQVLFALYGGTYGGDMRTTFGIPNMSGREMISQGQGDGLGDYHLGEVVMSRHVKALNIGTLPAHTHAIDAQGAQVIATVVASDSTDNAQTSPTDGYPMTRNPQTYAASGDVAMADGSLTGALSGSLTTQVAGSPQPASFPVGGKQLGLRACVQADGFFPQRP